jgi:hypothetical protein
MPKIIYFRLLKFIKEYSETDKPVTKCGTKGDYRVVMRLAKKCVVFRAWLNEQKALKSISYRDKSLTVLLPKSEETGLFKYPDYCYNHDADGNNTGTLSSSGVALLKAQSSSYLEMAKILERGQMNSKKEIEIRAIVETRNINIDLREIMQRDISDLAEFQTVE